jgi:hypothetical protein
MKYKITISRVQHSLKDFVVDAETPEEAEDIALDLAYGVEFSYGDADYEIDSCVEATDDEE